MIQAKYVKRLVPSVTQSTFAIDPFSLFIRTSLPPVSRDEDLILVTSEINSNDLWMSTILEGNRRPSGALSFRQTVG